MHQHVDTLKRHVEKPEFDTDKVSSGQSSWTHCQAFNVFFPWMQGVSLLELKSHLLLR